jgi:hypothetical protein
LAVYKGDIKSTNLIKTTPTPVITPIPPIFALGDTGIEIVVWSTIALAAFLPTVLLDWRTIVTRPTMKQTMATALDQA